MPPTVFFVLFFVFSPHIDAVFPITFTVATGSRNHFDVIVVAAGGHSNNTIVKASSCFNP